MPDKNPPQPGAAPSTHAAKRADAHPVHAPGIHVKWYVDALVEGHIYHGFIKQIFLHGTEIYLDLDLGLSKIKNIKLRIHVPPPSRTSPPHLIEVSGNVVFSAYNNEEALFHSGVHFLEFKDESDRKYLESLIAASNKTK